MERYRQYLLGIINSPSPEAKLFLAALSVLWISALVIVFSVIFKFTVYAEQHREKKSEKFHVVETFSMAAVIIIFFNILQSGFGSFRPEPAAWIFLEILGFILTAAGVTLHIWSKMAIGRYWSDQIEILKDHNIVTTGPYAIVRHPMYSSIILWMAGTSLMFANYCGFIFSAVVFVPMMIWRAGSEDKELKKLDPTAFGIYCRDVSMLLPKFNGPFSLILRLTAIAMLGFVLITRSMTTQMFVVVFIAHFLAGLLSYVPKIRFSFMNKSVIMLVIFLFSLRFSGAFWAYYVILIFDIYGLFRNCPCMWIYEKYHGCPCFGFAKKCIMLVK
jgi:protein-S-isoprenylcysteine O-methyltransferase